MSIEAMKKVLEYTEHDDRFPSEINHILMQAIAEAEKKNNGKLKVTLQDTPTEIELAQYKRMFEAACSALGAVGDALGVDPEEGGAEPIIAAIQELKAEKQEQLREENERLHVENRRLIDRIETIGVPVGVGGFVTTTTSPPQRQPLTDEQIVQAGDEARRSFRRHQGLIRGQQFVAADDYEWHLARAIEAAHGIKGEA